MAKRITISPWIVLKGDSVKRRSVVAREPIPQGTVWMVDEALIVAEQAHELAHAIARRCSECPRFFEFIKWLAPNDLDFARVANGLLRLQYEASTVDWDDILSATVPSYVELCLSPPSATTTISPPSLEPELPKLESPLPNALVEDNMNNDQSSQDKENEGKKEIDKCGDKGQTQHSSKLGPEKKRGSYNFYLDENPFRAPLQDIRRRVERARMVYQPQITPSYFASQDATPDAFVDFTEAELSVLYDQALSLAQAHPPLTLLMAARILLAIQFNNFGLPLSDTMVRSSSSSSSSSSSPSPFPSTTTPLQSSENSVCGLFFTASLINHSCWANAAWRVISRQSEDNLQLLLPSSTHGQAAVNSTTASDSSNSDVGYHHQFYSKSFTDLSGVAIELYALRDIEAGEELCISYDDVLTPQPQRSQHFATTYRFTCSCPRCVPLFPLTSTNPVPDRRLILLMQAKKLMEVVKTYGPSSSILPGSYETNLRKLMNEMPPDSAAIEGIFMARRVMRTLSQRKESHLPDGETLNCKQSDSQQTLTSEAFSEAVLASVVAEGLRCRRLRQLLDKRDLGQPCRGTVILLPAPIVKCVHDVLGIRSKLGEAPYYGCCLWCGNVVTLELFRKIQSNIGETLSQVGDKVETAIEMFNQGLQNSEWGWQPAERQQANDVFVSANGDGFEVAYILPSGSVQEACPPEFEETRSLLQQAQSMLVEVKAGIDEFVLPRHVANLRVQYLLHQLAMTPMHTYGQHNTLLRNVSAAYRAQSHIVCAVSSLLPTNHPVIAKHILKLANLSLKLASIYRNSECSPLLRARSVVSAALWSVLSHRAAMRSGLKLDLLAADHLSALLSDAQRLLANPNWAPPPSSWRREVLHAYIDEVMQSTSSSSPSLISSSNTQSHVSFVPKLEQDFMVLELIELLEACEA